MGSIQQGMKEGWSLEIKRSENQESSRTLDKSLLTGLQFPHIKNSGAGKRGQEYWPRWPTLAPEAQSIMEPFGKL